MWQWRKSAARAYADTPCGLKFARHPWTDSHRRSRSSWPSMAPRCAHDARKGYALRMRSQRRVRPRKKTLGAVESDSSARLPFSLQPLAAGPAARFFASSMSMHAASGSSSLGRRVSCTSRRVSVAIVVSRSWVGSISPRPLKRVTVTATRFLLCASIRSRRSCRAPHHRARSGPPCRHVDADTAAAWRRVHVTRLDERAGSAAGTARTAASRYAGRRNRHRPGCRSCDSAARRAGRVAGSTPSATLMLCTSWEPSNWRRIDFPGVEYLAAQGHHRPGVSRSRACFADPPAESPSTRKSSVSGGLLQRAVGELAGQLPAPTTTRLRTTFFRRLERANCALLDRQPRRSRRPFPGAGSARCAKLSLMTPVDESRALARAEPFLGLTGELRILHLHRQDDRLTPSQTSSGASFMPRGSRPRKSQNSRSASVSPANAGR